MHYALLICIIRSVFRKKSWRGGGLRNFGVRETNLGGRVEQIWRDREKLLEK